MKFLIEEHEEHQANADRLFQQEYEKLQRQIAAFQRLGMQNATHRAKIARAKKEKRDGFDSERYTVDEKLIIVPTETIFAQWKPIELIPKTLEKFLVVTTHGREPRLLEGLHAFNEPCSDRSHYYSHWLDHRPIPTK